MDSQMRAQNLLRLKQPSGGPRLMVPWSAVFTRPAARNIGLGHWSRPAIGPQPPDPRPWLADLGPRGLWSLPMAPAWPPIGGQLARSARDWWRPAAHWPSGLLHINISQENNTSLLSTPDSPASPQPLSSILTHITIQCSSHTTNQQEFLRAVWCIRLENIRSSANHLFLVLCPLHRFPSFFFLGKLKWSDLPTNRLHYLLIYPLHY